jgi:hypothetical protein
MMPLGDEAAATCIGVSVGEAARDATGAGADAAWLAGAGADPPQAATVAATPASANARLTRGNLIIGEPFICGIEQCLCDADACGGDCAGIEHGFDALP